MSRGLRLQDLAFLGRVGNQGVTPLSFPGLHRWYKADSYSGIANDGDSIGGGANTRGPWIEQTGSGDDATAVSGPIFKTNIVGTMPVIRFEIARPVMIFAPGVLSDFTIVFVAAATAQVGEDSFLFYNPVSAHQLRQVFFNIHSMAFYAGGAVITSDVFPGNTFDAAETKRSGTAITFRQNKVVRNSGVEGTPWTVTQIGNSAVGSVMDVGEILIYNTVISEANLDLLYDQYLKPRWVTLP